MGKAKLNPETGKMQPTGGYEVGFALTPVDTRFKPGQSGFPQGRPKGSRNRKTELQEIVDKKVEVVEDGKKRKMSLAAANLLTHGAKGAKGDARSANLFLNYAREMGLLDLEDSGSKDVRGQIGLPGPLRPSEALMQNLDLELLPRDEQIELSRLAEIMDLGGDFTALAADDFERLKFLINKGRGKDVTPK